MRLSRGWSEAGRAVLAASLVAVAGADAINCGGDGATSSSSGGSSSGGASCEPKDPSCSPVPSDCQALVDNSGQTKIQLRMAQLTITAPPALSTGIAPDLVAEGVYLNRPECYVIGNGTFSWLFEFDTASGTLKTGGAKPVSDPSQGYCFVNETIGSFDVKPVEVAAPIGTDGSFGVDDGPDLLIVPIYLDASSTTPILLPLHEVRIFEASISSDRNCIGKFNAEGLDPRFNCASDPEGGQPTFVNGAKLEGYITLEEADQVTVPQLSRSLCSLLAQESGPNCERDGSEFVTKGDWCSKTNSAATAGCTDAFRLAADFAASAVKIHGDCQ